jgi:hypothetical protein
MLIFDTKLFKASGDLGLLKKWIGLRNNNHLIPHEAHLIPTIWLTGRVDRQTEMIVRAQKTRHCASVIRGFSPVRCSRC